MLFDENYFNSGKKGYLNYKKFNHFKERAEWVINNLSGKVLEIGCAYGYLIEEIKAINNTFEIYGLDKSNYALVQANANISSLLFYSDIKDFIINPFYDWIISWNVLDCLDGDQHAQDIANVLNSGSFNQYHVLSMSGERYTKQGYFIKDIGFWRNLFPNAYLVDYETKIVYIPNGKTEKAPIPLCGKEVSE